MDIESTLIKRAREAREKAYAPYSKFPVGASLLTKSGKIILGCNIENASFGLSNCAERTAIFTALVQSEVAEDKEFVAMAVVAASPRPIPPCGACRQVLVEFCSPSMPIFLANLEGDMRKITVNELLPGAFGAQDLMNKE